MLILYQAVNGQPAWDNYEHITTAHGLSHNVVTVLYQDSEGLLWIGTNSGLCSYDGNKITIYKEIFGNIHSENWFHVIETIFEDSKRNIWVGSVGGLVSCFRREQQVWKIYSGHAQHPFTVHSFAEDARGRIWVGGYGRLGVVSGDSIKYRHFADDIVGLIVDNERLLIATKGKFISYSPAEDRMYPLLTETFSKDALRSAVKTGRNILIEYSDRFVICRLTDMKKVLDIAPVTTRQGNYNKVILSSDSGYLFTDANVIRKYTSSGELAEELVISDNLSYDKNEIVNCLTEDNSGILWLGTNAGLYKVNSAKYRFKKYSRNNVAGKLSYNYVRAIYPDKSNNIWVGYKAGMIDKLCYDVKRSRYIATALAIKPDKQTDPFTTNTFLQLKSNRILAGCTEGLFYINEKTGRVEPFNMASGIRPTEVWSLLEDGNANIWIGSRTGLIIANPLSGEMTSYGYDARIISGIGNNPIWNIYQDMAGVIWLATDNGLYKAIPADRSVNGVRFEKHLLDKTIREAIHVWSLAEDKGGNLWVGTTGHGMFKISADRKQTTHPGVVPNKVISSLQFDREQQLWISTPNGLYRYDPATGKCTGYDEQDGLISNDYNFKVCAITTSGELFFGGKMGMVSFFPSAVTTTGSTNAPVKITGVRVNGKDMTAAAVGKHQLELAYSQNNIDISFTILDFAKPSSHRFRYMLKGFDKSWRYAAADQPVATYTNIPYGKYDFIVEGSSNGISWSRQKQTIPVIIRPAFWQRKLFLVFMCVLPAALIALIIYNRTRALVKREREKNVIEKQLASLELKALQLQMDPHFIFNVINSIQHFILSKDEVSTNEYLSRFARLMRLFLESSKSKFLPLAQEIELIELYLSIEQMRFDDKFTYTIETSCTDTSKISIPSMLIQPFVENAVNHGLVHRELPGNLVISFIQEGDCIRCIIDDNGIGREKSALMKTNRAHRSRGMELIGERIKAYNFISEKKIDLTITDKKPAEGTTVELLIPVALQNVEIVLPW